MPGSDVSTNRWPIRLAWSLIAVLLTAIVVARITGPHRPHDLPILRLVLSFAECGVILWSLAGTVGDLVYHGDPNINVTIFNTCILIAGLCHLAGAALAVGPPRRLRPPLVWLVAASALILGLVWLVAHAALAGWLPIFFVSGQGGTKVRYGVLASAIGAFVLSAALLSASQRTARPFTSWYVPALLMLAVGLFGVMVQVSFGSLVNWLARVAQWLGGMYLLAAAVAALRESHLSPIPLGDFARPPLYREAMAIVVVFAAAAVRLVFLDGMGARAPFVTFYPAVLLVTLYGGWRSGVLATILSAVLADYFWLLPEGVGSIDHPGDALALAVFGLSSTVICVVADSMRRAQSCTAVR